MEPEVEVKFALRHLANLRQDLLSKGASLQRPRTLERNWRYDQPDGRLAQSGAVLRLRQDERVRLTYKQTLKSKLERQEIEFEVDDAESAKQFLRALGYQIIARYEKYREVFHLKGCSLMLDELPFGCFVEIEGPSLSAIQELSGDLGLVWERRVEDSYLELFQALKEARQLGFRDATFENFEGAPALGPDDLGLENAYAGGFGALNHNG